MKPLTVGQWYVDRTPGHDGQSLEVRFQLVAVSVDTVEVMDEGGCRRTVNRALWERDMTPLRQPV
jgi:hypothetical protein